MSFSITHLPDEINLKIISFLDKKDLGSMALTCKGFQVLTGDFQIWLPKTEHDFGFLVSHGAKQQTKSWKKIYEELRTSRETRTEKLASILHTHMLKLQKDELFFRGSVAISHAMGLPPPRGDVHFYPRQQSDVNGRKITNFIPK